MEAESRGRKRTVVGSDRTDEDVIHTASIPNEAELAAAAVWLRHLFRRFPLPRNYLVFDSETTGRKLGYDFIWQYAVCRVENCEIVEPLCVTIDWTRHPDVSVEWLDRRFRDQNHPGVPYEGKILSAIEYMQAVGKHPEEALHLLNWLLIEHRVPRIGHNIVGFDARILSELSSELSDEFPIRLDRCGDVIDSGGLEIAVQLREQLLTGSSLAEYCAQQMRMRSKVPWSLFRHCVRKYRFVERFDLPMGEAHTADFDTLVVHLLIEEYRALGQSNEQRTIA